MLWCLLKQLMSGLCIENLLAFAVLIASNNNIMLNIWFTAKDSLLEISYNAFTFFNGILYLAKQKLFKKIIISS